MFHKDPFVMAPETFKLIQELQAIPELSDFNLVGGTTLALYPLINSVIALRAITFFDDINPDIDPPKMLKPISIDRIKKRITDAVISSNKIFR